MSKFRLAAFILLVLVGCKKGDLIEPTPNWEVGKIKSIELIDSVGNVQKYDYKYEIFAKDSAVKVKQLIYTDAKNKISETLTFTRDDRHVLKTAKRVYKQKDSTFTNTRLYLFSSLFNDFPSHYVDTVRQLYLVGDYYQLTTFKFFTGIIRFNVKDNHNNSTNFLRYEWQGLNYSLKIYDQNDGKVEFYYYRFDDKKKNPIEDLYRNYVGFWSRELTFTCPYLPNYYEEQLAGKNHTYEYSYDTEGRLVESSLLLSKQGTKVLRGKMKISYYTK